MPQLLWVDRSVHGYTFKSWTLVDVQVSEIQQYNITFSDTIYCSVFSNLFVLITVPHYNYILNIYLL